MPRHLRHLPGGTVFHVLNRGVGRQTLFHKDEDYAAFERVMAEAFQRVAVRILCSATIRGRSRWCSNGLCSRRCAPASERFAIRWNDGPWMTGGVGKPLPDCIPPTTHFRLNNGGPADWDPMWGSMGTVSLYSNIAIPEPTCCLLPAACLPLLARK